MKDTLPPNPMKDREEVYEIMLRFVCLEYLPVLRRCSAIRLINFLPWS